MINYVPKIRVQQAAGAAIVYNLRTITIMTKAQPVYDRMIVEQEMLDRSVREARLGYRVRCVMEFLIPQAPHADQNTLHAITGHLAEPTTVVEVSMGNDEFGVERYRKVGMFEESVEPVEGVLSMMRYAWVLTCEALIPRAPSPGVGAVAIW